MGLTPSCFRLLALMVAPLLAADRALRCLEVSGRAIPVGFGIVRRGPPALGSGCSCTRALGAAWGGGGSEGAGGGNVP